jgi:hypothetical protein
MAALLAAAENIEEGHRKHDESILNRLADVQKATPGAFDSPGA